MARKWGTNRENHVCEDFVRKNAILDPPGRFAGIHRAHLKIDSIWRLSDRMFNIDSAQERSSKTSAKLLSVKMNQLGEYYNRIFNPIF